MLSIHFCIRLVLHYFESKMDEKNGETYLPACKTFENAYQIYTHIHKWINTNQSENKADSNPDWSRDPNFYTVDTNTTPFMQLEYVKWDIGMLSIRSSVVCFWGVFFFLNSLDFFLSTHSASALTKESLSIFNFWTVSWQTNWKTKVPSKYLFHIDIFICHEPPPPTHKIKCQPMPMVQAETVAN